MSTSRGTWRRPSRSSSAFLLAAFVVAACGAAKPSTSSDTAGLAFTRYAAPEKPSVWVADMDGSNARAGRRRRLERRALARRPARYISVRAESDTDDPSLYVHDVG